MAEYVVILASIALIGLTSGTFLSGRISGFFGSVSSSPGIGSPIAPAPLTPPVQLPTLVEQCLEGRWHNYPRFADEAACIQFVTGVQPPTLVEQCLDGGWQNYPQFVDEAACIRFVTDGG
jgi:hypothetical protein